MLRNRHTTLLSLLLGTAIGTAALAGPPAERTLVSAVADQNVDRVLVRWNFVEGRPGRYAFFDVTRREATATSFVTLNAQPIGPLTSIVEIEALFADPANMQALSEIQASLGVDYASKLLQMQQPPTNDTQKAQTALIPDLNFGAAIALGLGYLDAEVVNGTTYVYEVWGVDAQGVPQERLGRASATAGQPYPLQPAQEIECVELDDPRGDMAVYLRWDENAPTEQSIAGYDVFRAPYDVAMQKCHEPVDLTHPDTIKVNQFPTTTDTPGDPGLGRDLFLGTCASCHQAADPRNTPPDFTMSQNGLQATTVGDYYRTRDANLAPGHSHVGNSLLDPLSAEDLRLIYSWVEEFQFRDGGEDTPEDPLVEDEKYCYSVAARNLLGQYGPPTTQSDCTARDLRPPAVPSGIESVRLVDGDHEICVVSWDANDGPDDDTAYYELTRVRQVPRYGDLFNPAAPGTFTQIVPHQPGGRIEFPDMSQSVADAGQPYFYAVQAVDDSGQQSGYGGWVPCIPRDLVAPDKPQIVAVECCDTGIEEVCRRRDDDEWLEMGGEPIVISDPRGLENGDCPVRIFWTGGTDTAGVRVETSHNNSGFLPGEEIFQSPFNFNFKPLTDTLIKLNLCPFDKSNNYGPCAGPIKLLLKGSKRLPAPIIDEVAIENENTGQIVLRFRSLNPDSLIGFALYQQPRPTANNDDLEPQGDLVTRLYDGNVSTTALEKDPVNAPDIFDQWVVTTGTAKTVEEVLADGNVPPCTTGQLPLNETLCYNPLKKQYVMRATLGQTPTDVVLKLMAIGWSGWESESVPYFYAGLQPNPGVLAWPYFRSRQFFAWMPGDNLSITPTANDITLSWGAFPDGCLNNFERPFVVYRQRGNSPLWKQISPPFVCDLNLANPAAMQFHDTDVEPGVSYSYRVLRLGRNGEFSFRYGPSTPATLP